MTRFLLPFHRLEKEEPVRLEEGKLLYKSIIFVSPTRMSCDPKYSEFKKITNGRAENYADRFSIFSGTEITYSPSSEQYQVADQLGKHLYSFDQPDFNVKEFFRTWWSDGNIYQDQPFTLYGRKHAIIPFQTETLIFTAT